LCCIISNSIEKEWFRVGNRDKMIMKSVYITLLVAIVATGASGQNTESPYVVKPAIDIPVTVGAAGLAFVGLEYILNKKDPLDSAYVATLHPGMVSDFDRGATKYFPENPDRPADYTLYASFLVPFALLADKHIRSDKGKIGLMYLETMAVMGLTYTWGVGFIDRKRPYVYNPDVPVSEKLGKGTQNSFFAGHPAAAAASTFFAAKVYSDYHPDNSLKYVLWGAAIIPPALVGYFRYKTGAHFPTDIIAGIPIGMLIGIGIPELHRRCRHNEKLSIVPGLNGIGLSYKL
jgi:hypothetical protein